LPISAVRESQAVCLFDPWRSYTLPFRAASICFSVVAVMLQPVRSFHLSKRTKLSRPDEIISRTTYFAKTYAGFPNTGT